MTSALLPILALVLAVDAPAATGTSSRAAAAQRFSPRQSARSAGSAETVLPAAKPAERPPAPPAATRSAAEAEEGEVLLRQKCSKCHELSLAWSSRLSDAQWRLHMRRMASRPGAAITDEQARKIRGALEEHRARSAKR